jgi:hypothetical protein
MEVNMVARCRYAQTKGPISLTYCHALLRNVINSITKKDGRSLMLVFDNPANVLMHRSAAAGDLFEQCVWLINYVGCRCALSSGQQQAAVVRHGP